MHLASLMRRLLSRRFLKFGIVGGSGIVVNLGLLYAGREYLFNQVQPIELRLNLALAVAIFFATLNNFFWNRLWTWADRNANHHRHIVVQFGQYGLACWVSIVLQAIFTNLLAPHFYFLVANLIAIAVTSVLNFILNDIWTFGRVKLRDALSSDAEK
jgi:dolichol-phosphate mannosyltransferase